MTSARICDQAQDYPRELTNAKLEVIPSITGAVADSEDWPLTAPADLWGVLVGGAIHKYLAVEDIISLVPTADTSTKPTKSTPAHWVRRTVRRHPFRKVPLGRIRWNFLEQFRVKSLTRATSATREIFKLLVSCHQGAFWALEA